MKTIAKFVFLGLALSAVNMAQAQDTYVTFSAGQTQVRKFCDGVVGSCDDKGTGFKAFVGHNFTSNVGVEFGYVDFGKVSGTDNSLGFPISAEAKAYALGGSVVGNLPFDAFSLFGKAGAWRCPVHSCGLGMAELLA